MERGIDEALEDLGISRKIRELRQGRRFTLQDMSAKTGLSKPLLSQVENGHVMPPVATLLKIARALEVDISFFFQSDGPEDKIAITKPEERRALTHRPHQEAGDPGYQYEILELHKPRKSMQPLLVTFDYVPEDQMLFYSHEGEECVYVLSGSIEFRTHDEVRTLEEGDCLYFESDVPHSFRSPTREIAKALVVVLSH